jgi:hypothetical protein
MVLASREPLDEALPFQQRVAPVPRTRPMLVHALHQLLIAATSRPPEHGLLLVGRQVAGRSRGVVTDTCVTYDRFQDVGQTLAVHPATIAAHSGSYDECQHSQGFGRSIRTLLAKGRCLTEVSMKTNAPSTSVPL